MVSLLTPRPILHKVGRDFCQPPNPFLRPRQLLGHSGYIRPYLVQTLALFRQHLRIALRTSITAMRLASLCAIVLSFARVNVGDISNNLFIFPTAPGPSNNFVADLSWALGSTQKIQWSTSVDSYYIALFQQATNPASGNSVHTIYSRRI